MSTHVIYIPGLGDRYDGFRKWAISFWRLWGVSAEHVAITWYDGKDFEQKMQLVTDAIEKAKGKRIVLIGESAGATLALHTSTRQSIARVITLCGVSQPKTPIADYLRRKAPALSQAVDSLPTSFITDIHSVRAFVDGTVGPKWSKTNNATVHTVWTIGHLTTIATCLTVLAPLMVTIAKK